MGLTGPKGDLMTEFAWSAAAAGALAAAIALGGTSMASEAPPAAEPASSSAADAVGAAASDKPLECGVASYYADMFVGRTTANGERYSHEALTAAHKTLPFGAELVVRRLSDGAEVAVRINDRGPFIKGRIIDLSKAAAREIGMIRAGVVDVCIYEKKPS